MSQVREQQHRIEDIRSAKYITGALRDISAVELKHLRERFDKNSVFYTELRDLYQLMWQIAEASGGSAPNKKRGSVLHVAYTTNRHFYGALNYNVMESFMQATGTDNRCIVIGDTGKQIWAAAPKKRREVTFMSFVSDMPTPDETRDFLVRVDPYSQVFVYYPGFVSVFGQRAEIVDITYRPSSVAEGALRLETFHDAPQYLLEPDLSQMQEFFNTQVRNVLFERMLLETQLSRVAARLVKMDTADQNADSLMVHETQELRRAFTSVSSRRMLETLVGYLQWHTQKLQPVVR